MQKWSYQEVQYSIKMTFGNHAGLEVVLLLKTNKQDSSKNN